MDMYNIYVYRGKERGRELGLDRSSGEGSGRLQGGAGVVMDGYMTSKGRAK